MFARLRAQRVDKSKELTTQMALVSAILFVQMTAISIASIVTYMSQRMYMLGAMATAAKLNSVGMMMRYNTMQNYDKCAYHSHNQWYVSFLCHITCRQI